MRQLNNVDSLIFLRSVGTGTNPNIHLPARGLVALDLFSTKEQFIIPAPLAILSANRKHFYDVTNNEINVFDTQTGKLVKNLKISGDLNTELDNRKILKRDITVDEKWFYQVSGVTEYPLLLQTVDLKNGNVPASIYISDTKCTTVAYVQNGQNSLYLRCKDTIKQLYITKNVIANLEISSKSLLALSNNMQELYVLSDGLISIVDNRANKLVGRLSLEIGSSQTFYKLLVSRNGSKLIAVSKLYKSSAQGNLNIMKPIGTHFEIFDLRSRQKMSNFDWEYDFQSIEISWDGRIIYGLVLKQTDQAIDSEYIKCDSATGKVLLRRTLPQEIITELLLV
jgi:hypothetical protein